LFHFIPIAFVVRKKLTLKRDNVLVLLDEFLKKKLGSWNSKLAPNAGLKF
jgi:hypothetical protein